MSPIPQSREYCGVYNPTGRYSGANCIMGVGHRGLHRDGSGARWGDEAEAEAPAPPATDAG